MPANRRRALPRPRTTARPAQAACAAKGRGAGSWTRARLFSALRCLGLALGAAWLAGCYAYVPLRSSAPRTTELRVALARPFDVRLTDVTANAVVLADGELVRMDSSDVVLSASRLVSNSGYEQFARGETVTLARNNIVAIERRRISVPRTLLATAVVIVGLTVGGVALGGGFGTGRGGGPGPHPK